MIDKKPPIKISKLIAILTEQLNETGDDNVRPYTQTEEGCVEFNFTGYVYNRRGECELEMEKSND